MPIKSLFIKAWREKFGLTQEQLAGRLGATQTTVSRWETDSRRPRVNELDAIAKAIHATLAGEDLMRDPQRPEAEGMRIIRGLDPNKQEDALRILRALAGHETAA